MIWASSTQACGIFSTYRENTSQVISAVSATIAQAQTWPASVDALSTHSNAFCMRALPRHVPDSAVCSGVPNRDRKKSGRPAVTGRPRATRSTLLLGRRLAGGLLGEEVVIGHLVIDVGVVLPTAGTLGKAAHRVENLLESGILGALGGDDLVPGGQLGTQDGIRRLPELDALLFLHLDVVLGITVYRLPAHVGRSGLHGIVDDRLHVGRQ